MRFPQQHPPTTPVLEQGTRVRSVPAACVLAVVLIVLLPVLVLRPHHGPLPLALVLQGVVVAHTGGALTRVLTAPRIRLVGLGFWMFSYIWLGLAPLPMLSSDTYPWPYRAGEETSLWAVALVELGLLAYSAGTAHAAGRARLRAARPGRLERLLARRVSPWRVLLLCGLALALAALLIPGQSGGVGAYFTSREAVRETGALDAGPDAFLQPLRSWSLSVPAFWALLSLLRLPNGDRMLRGLRWLLLPLLVGVNLIVNNPISKPRFWAGTVLLTLLFNVPRLCRPRASRALAVAVLGTVLVAFPYSDYFRYDDRHAVSVVSLSEQFTTKGDYDAFQQVQTGLDYARENGFSPRQALGPVFFLVPRSVWPDKPDDTGIALAQYAGYDFLNLSAPLWIEAYLWAGPPAVALVFCLLGMAGRRMDEVRDRLQDRPGSLAVLVVPAFAFYQLMFLRGSLLGITGPMLLLLTVPLLISAPARRAADSAVPAPLSPFTPHASLPHTGGHL
ncbi:hypothetical protein FB563_3985 [Streptomyces puniciscabiei]|uniref:Oligosaccharide repeat unit polymerase n=1 Tax=Streptomyces puniciscabiei TaxID=164348 RepID=A0A542UIP1_9ACTN|nr:hypothetical protein [Streptomyces puniciscabiei]TQK98937.1 hypothetical protein FB563_3985 [Streptomyces puniciscabiei]